MKTPPRIRKFLRQLQATGVTLYRNGQNVTLSSNAPPHLQEAFTAHHDELVALVLPHITTEQRAQVATLLDGLTVTMVADTEATVVAVAELLKDARESGIVAVDTETEVLPEYRGPVPVAINQDGSIAARQPKDGAAGYALDPRRARVRLLQAYAGGSGVYLFDMARLAAWNELTPLFSDAPALAMFNGVFDIKMVIASGGPEPTTRVYDTQLAMRLLESCEHWPIGMDRAVADLLEVTLPKALGASDWSGDLDNDQIDYAALDPVVTFDLWTAQRNEFDHDDDNLSAIVDGCLVAVARMELAGMPVDVEAHREFIAQWREELKAADAALQTTTGGKLRGVPTDNEIRAYLTETLTADQLDAWPQTKTGLLAVNKTVFRTNGDGVPGLVELEAVKALAKGLSTYGDGMLARVDDGRIYARFLVAGARTGRFSSREPNLQNIPKRSKLFRTFRRIFRAPTGYVMMAADYSQIELREMAEQSGDVTMLDAYQRYGEVHRDPEARKVHDIHTTTANRLCPDMAILDADAQDRERSTAKAANFGLIYGSGAKGFAQYAKAQFGLDLTVEDAEDIIDVFFGAYPAIQEWQQEQGRETKERGYVQTLGGRRWYWDWRAKDIDDPALDDLEEWQLPDALSGFERNLALNFPIQGTCAEILQVALDYVDEALRPYDARMVATVHDEVVSVVRDDPATVRAVRRVLVTKMTRAWLEFHPDAPWRGLVEVGVGSTWADAH